MRTNDIFTATYSPGSDPLRPPTYLLSRGQVDFWKAEAAKGDPVVLMMHIPLYVKSGSKYFCGSPFWGAKIDPYWRIERRPRWQERANDETFNFREAVLSTPNLVGVFTGHIHQSISMRANGQNMFSVAACRGSKKSLGLPKPHLDVTLS